MEINFIGVIVGLAVAIYLIVKKLNPVTSLFAGTIVGALLGATIAGGGASLAHTFDLIVRGTQSVMGVNVRVIAGGILAGVLLESGAAETIARTIVDKLGEKRAILSIALAGMILTASGIFITVTIVMLSPIALSVGNKAKLTKMAVILALSGGAKAGNVMSPNPNTVAAAEAFGVSVSQVLLNGIVPAVFALLAAVFFAGRLKAKGSAITDKDVDGASSSSDLPSFGKSIAAPILAISLLILSPIGDILGIDALSNFQVDSFFILPLAAVVGTIIMGKTKHIVGYVNSGVTKMMPITLVLTGAGAIGGLVTGSDFPALLVNGMQNLGIPEVLLAPVSGILMASAAGSTVTGVILATSAFSETIIAFGISAISAAVMVHAGAMFIDVMPHGNIFLASKESMKVDMKERLKVVPYEAAVGGVMTLVATIMYGFIL